MRFWKAGGTALVLGSAAFIIPADTTVQAQTWQREAVTVPRVVDVWAQGSGSRLGVSIDDVSADDVKSKKLASQSGALIQDVDADTPASKAGLKAGDVVLEFDGERIRSARQLTRLIQETPAGRQVAIVVSRDGQRMNLSVTPESRDRFATLAPSVRIDAMPTPPRAPRATRPPQVWTTPRESLRAIPPMPRPTIEIPRLEAFRDGFAYSFGGGRLGVATQSLTGQLAKHFGVERGVLVTEVTEDSAASKAGIRAGDVITKVNDESIDDTVDLLRELGRRDGEVTIEIVRGGKTQTVKATIEAARPRTIRRQI